jgi:hypothetical protein
MKHDFRWRKITYGLCLSAFLLASGCGGKKSNGESPPESTEENAAQVRDEVLKSLRESDVARQFSTFAFQEAAVNDIGRLHHYLQQGNKGVAAINLGAYMSDLSYVAQFDRKEDMKRYFEGCFLLADHVGMKKLFSHSVELRFSQIISGNEALDQSLSKLFKNAENTTDDFKKMHAAALTGYYIEELYHLVVFVKSPSSQQADSVREMKLRALQTLIRQKSEVGNLIGYFDHLHLQPAAIALYQEFLKMQNKYQSLDTERLLKETDPDKVLQDKSFVEILDSLSSIREFIVNS